MWYSFPVSQQSLFQTNLHIIKEIIPNSFEERMFLLPNSQNDIPLYHVRHLFSFSFKNDCVSICHSLFYCDFQLFWISNHLFPLTMRTVSSINLASSLAPITVSLHLHLHSKADLDLLQNHSLTIAFRANLGLSILSSSPPTLWAIDISLDCHCPMTS